MSKHKDIVVGDLQKAKRGLAGIAADQGCPLDVAELFVQHGIELGGELAQARKDAERAADPSVDGISGK